ncbi:glycosyltransferase family 2 protein [Cronobacter muytjensii]|nr:glycosyltransferase family 2 protein [Cronobacter muytjensii]
MISIITPTFNSEYYIKKQHDRLRKLLSRNIQWVIVDDASSDNTENTVKNFNNQFIIYHKLAKNSGPSIARHKGVELSKTDLVYFLDADDVLLENNFKLFLEFIKEKSQAGFDFFYAPSFTSNSEVNISKENYQIENKERIIKKATDFIKYGMPNFSSLAIQKEFFLNNIPYNSLPWGEDIAIYICLVSKGCGIKWKLPVSCYIITGDGRGSKLSLRGRTELFIFLLKYSLKPPLKATNFLFSFFIILRSICSYLYKRIRG